MDHSELFRISKLLDDVIPRMGAMEALQKQMDSLNFGALYHIEKNWYVYKSAAELLGKQSTLHHLELISRSVDPFSRMSSLESVLEKGWRTSNLLDFNKSVFERYSEISNLSSSLQGFYSQETEEEPLEEETPHIEDGELEIDQQSLIFTFGHISNQLIHYIMENPQEIHSLTPRQFEELIAELFIKEGCNVELTQATRDGGKDLIVYRNDIFGNQKYVVECKKYSQKNKVGINVIQRLYGVQMGESANKGYVITSSSFTQAAKDYAIEHSFALDLKEYQDVTNWIKSHYSE
jgi:HJR/Mrr/RecB family endonuclease